MIRGDIRFITYHGQFSHANKPDIFVLNSLTSSPLLIVDSLEACWWHFHLELKFSRYRQRHLLVNLDIALKRMQVSGQSVWLHMPALTVLVTFQNTGPNKIKVCFIQEEFRSYYSFFSLWLIFWNRNLYLKIYIY